MPELRAKKTIREAVARVIQSFRRVNGIELPDQGRSSVEGNLASQIQGALSQFGGLQPEISFQYLEILKQLWVWNPLFNQFADNLKSLGNTGHSIVVDAATEQRATAALQRINEASARLWSHGAGVDGLVNQYIGDIAWSGALASEDVVNFAARRVEKTVIVPVEQIRFTWDGENYLPHQQPKNWIGPMNKVGLVQLNPETFKYYALETIGNSPYAKPPASSAIEDLTGPYADGKTNLKSILKKFGLLGFVAMQVAPPTKKVGETDDEYATRAKTYLGRVLSAVKDSWNNGLIATFRDQKIEHHAITAGAQGVKDTWEILEGGIFNGFAQQPAFFGRVHSTTETFADVVYSILVAQVQNIQRLPKRRLESTYRLDLRLGGIEVNAVNVKFNAVPSRNALRDAQADQARVRTVLEKGKAGIISPDQAAQELGYDSAFDPEMLSGQPDVAAALGSQSRAAAQFSATFRFDRSAQRYIFVPPQIVAGAALVGAGNVVRGEFAKKKIS